MKQPLWKRLLSYFTEIELEAASSHLNPEIVLSLRKGRYYLTTPNAIYSYGDLYDNFSRTFQQMGIDKLKIKEVLILGFGMGSIPFMLEKVFKKNYRYTGIEADEVIAFWASKYVMKDLSSPVEMHISDAYYFVENCADKFDLVIMDIFVDDEIPADFEETDFLENLKDLLEPNGWLLYNRLTYRPEDKQETEEFFEKRFKIVFPESTYFDLSGNWMLINRPV